MSKLSKCLIVIAMTVAFLATVYAKKSKKQKMKNRMKRWPLRKWVKQIDRRGQPLLDLFCEMKDLGELRNNYKNLKTEWSDERIASRGISCSTPAPTLNPTTTAPTPTPINYCNDKIEGYVQNCVDNPGTCKGGNTAEELLVTIDWQGSYGISIMDPSYWFSTWQANMNGYNEGYDSYFDWQNPGGGHLWQPNSYQGQENQNTTWDYYMPYQELDTNTDGGLDAFEQSVPVGNTFGGQGGWGCNAFACDPDNKVLFVTDFMNDIIMDAGKCHNN